MALSGVSDDKDHPMRMPISRAAAAAATVVGLGLVSALVSGPAASASTEGPQATAAAGASVCGSSTVRPTVEQARLIQAVPQQILRASTADQRVDRFAADLCAAGDATSGGAVVERHAAELWSWATARAQSKSDVPGSLPGGDDRPLYWARVAMTWSLAQWADVEGVPREDTRKLQNRLETASRGQDGIMFPQGDNVVRVLATGFDPFTLDVDPRLGNPSGANALALDGTWMKVGDEVARVETAIFPVRWDDFAAGEVERTLAPHLRGRAAVDVLATVSQGRPGQFDLEVWNGANRGGFGDNANLERTGLVPIPSWAPTVTPQPQFTRTNLPTAPMSRRATGDYPVKINFAITQRDPETGEVETTTDGPTPGWEAVSGGPGDYLSNEIAYRATLLRDALGAGNVGGHIHTPVLGVPDGDAVTDAGYEARRAAMVAQNKALIRVAAATR